MLFGNFSETFTSPRCCLAFVIQEELVPGPRRYGLAIVIQGILSQGSGKLLCGKYGYDIRYIRILSYMPNNIRMVSTGEKFFNNILTTNS